MFRRSGFPLSVIWLCRALLCLVLVTFFGCASAPTQGGAADATTANEASRYDDRDPLEGMNRAIYVFNDKLDRYIMKPVAKGYRFITPSFVRRGIANFFSNLYDPANMAHNFLQGKFAEGTSDLGRFFFNSTIGVFGLFDVASHMGLEKHDEDLGQTLGVWGVGEGPYLVLPVLGPSTLRDGTARVPDTYLYPPTYMEQRSAAGKLMLGEVVSRREQLLDASDILDQAAGEDPYTFVREAFRQRRQNQIYDGNPPPPPADPSLFDDEPLPPTPPR
jgi:phospholipid-binding lipoprotein MlaA